MKIMDLGEFVPTTTWLKSHQHKNYGVGTKKIDDTHFIIKSIKDKK